MLVPPPKRPWKHWAPPELTLQKPLEKLEFQSVKLPECTATALSSITRILKLKSTEVYADCASLLFKNITTDCQSKLEVLEIQEDVTIPTNHMTSLVRKKPLVFSRISQVSERLNVFKSPAFVLH